MGFVTILILVLVSEFILLLPSFLVDRWDDLLVMGHQLILASHPLLVEWIGLKLLLLLLIIVIVLLLGWVGVIVVYRLI